jgi:4'-phosphopantetheinyl transferase
VTGSDWRRPEGPVALPPGEVHVWRVPLDAPAGALSPLGEALHEEERDRAARFHFEKDRGRYIVAHHALRSLLARYRSAERCGERFVLGPAGKPGVGGGPHFNLSHSRALGLVALSADRDVGVDVEAVDGKTEIDALAERFFSPGERAALLGLDPALRREGFYHIWCQKEAYLKARGDGVTQGLDHFDVVADPREGAGLLADRKDPPAPGRWSLLAVDPGTGFRGAVAVAGGAPVLRCFEWS